MKTYSVYSELSAHGTFHGDMSFAGGRFRRGGASHGEACTMAMAAVRGNAARPAPMRAPAADPMMLLNAAAMNLRSAEAAAEAPRPTV